MINKMLVSIIMLIGGICGIAVSSIATECYDQNQEFKEEKKSNFNFIVVYLVFNIFMVLSAFAVGFLGFREIQG